MKIKKYILKKPVIKCPEINTLQFFNQKNRTAINPNKQFNLTEQFYLHLRLRNISETQWRAHICIKYTTPKIYFMAHDQNNARQIYYTYSHTHSLQENLQKKNKLHVLSLITYCPFPGKDHKCLKVLQDRLRLANTDYDTSCVLYILESLRGSTLTSVFLLAGSLKPLPPLLRQRARSHLAGHGGDEGGSAAAALLRLQEGDLAAGREVPHDFVEPVAEAETRRQVSDNLPITSKEKNTRRPGAPHRGWSL